MRPADTGHAAWTCSKHHSQVYQHAAEDTAIVVLVRLRRTAADVAAVVGIGLVAAPIVHTVVAAHIMAVVAEEVVVACFRAGHTDVVVVVQTVAEGAETLLATERIGLEEAVAAVVASAELLDSPGRRSSDRPWASCI